MLKQKITIILIAMCILFTNFNEILSHDSLKIEKTIEQSNKFWINYGGSLIPDILNGFGTVVISYLNNNNLFTGRYMHHGEFDFFAPFPLEEINEFAIMYGISTNSKFTQASISTGLSVLTMTQRGEFLREEGGSSGEILNFGRNYYETVRTTTIGIPIEAQLFFTPFSFIGIGLFGFANINPQLSFVGAGIAFRFGSLH